MFFFHPHLFFEIDHTEPSRGRAGYIENQISATLGYPNVPIPELYIFGSAGYMLFYVSGCIPLSRGNDVLSYVQGPGIEIARGSSSALV